MPAAKICGLSDQSGLDAALAGGARYVGFVVFPRSPRHIAPQRAAALAAQARGRAETVAVLVNPSDADLAALATLAPDWLQLHGNESPARAAEVRPHARKGIIKALQISAPADLDAARAYEPAADMLLFDAKPPPGADRPGGHGAAFDWRILAGRRFSRPWLLSGGLTPENVAEAARISHAPLVDVSSGVETAPGLKDPARIAAFLAAAHSTLEPA